MGVRAIRRRDLGSVCRALTERARGQHERRFQEQAAGRYRYLIAWDGSRPVGHVGLVLPSDRHPTDLCEWGDAGIVEDLWVQERARGRGLGRALMAELEREARAAGLSAIGLDTGLDDGYAVARGLYGRMGYERVSGPYIVSAELPAGHPTLPYWIETVTRWTKPLRASEAP
jgi:GNAT superfamily N-acetyltransferase